MKIIIRGHTFNVDMTQLRILLVFFVQYIIDLLSFGKLNDSVVMYGGHGLTGNLKGFWDLALENELGYEVYYAAFDKDDYNKSYEKYGDNVIYGLSFSGMRNILNSKILMTSHGPGLFYALKWLKSKIKFVDVWHGIPFKRFKPGYWDIYKFYSAMFVPSEYIRQNLYLKNYGLDAEKIFATGYSRVDRFFDPKNIAERVRKEIGLDEAEHIILFAPTWRPFETDKNKEIPFGMGYKKFFTELNELCEKINSVLIFRPHMSSLFKEFDLELGNVKFVPQRTYPETNDLLTVVDLLITDWSSIALDIYALKKPVIYVESDKPLNCADDEPLIERVGTEAKDIKKLLSDIEKTITDDRDEIEASLSDVIEKCYGDTLDGCSARRYDSEIRKLLLM